MAKKEPNNNKQIVVLLLVIVAIVILFVALIDIAAVMRQLKDANLPFIGAASLMLILGLITFAVRWRTLLGNKPGLLFTFHAANMGFAGNIIIPFRAGELIRILVIGSDESISLTESTTSVVVERLFEQLLRLTTFTLAVFVGVGLQLSAGSVIGGVGFLVMGFGIITWLVNHQEFTLDKGTTLLAKLPRVTEEKARRSLSDLLENLKGVSRPRQFALILFWSVITWAFFWAFFYLTLLSLDTDLAFEQQLAISLGALALSPPSAPTQPSIFHASIVLPLSALGANPEMLTAYAVLLHIQEMFWMIGFGLWGLFATGMSLSSVREQI